MAQAASNPPAKLLATGGARKVNTTAAHPTLYHFIGSFNSGKASLAARLCSRSGDFELKYTLHLRDNYQISYARLNPDTMAVPTMCIDDWIFTDSFDGIKYLQEKYPGDGDKAIAQNGQGREVAEFIELARSWDEYMFTYGNMGQASSDDANGIRLVNLRMSLKQVLDEKPSDHDFLVDAYVKKIAGITIMKQAQVEGDQKQRRLAENVALLHKVLEKAEQILESNGKQFLFTDSPSTADVYLLPIFRIFHLAVPQFWTEHKMTYPKLNAYWERAKLDLDVDVGLMKYVKTPVMLCAMIGAGVPWLMLKWKCGCLKAPALPQDIEERIRAKTDELGAAHKEDQ